MASKFIDYLQELEGKKFTLKRYKYEQLNDQKETIVEFVIDDKINHKFQIDNYLSLEFIENSLFVRNFYK
jgi:hypothetical protein